MLEWKRLNRPDRIRTIVKVYLLQDLVEVHSHQHQTQLFYVQTLKFLSRLLRNDLCLEMTANALGKITEASIVPRYHNLLCMLLKERNELLYNPVYYKLLKGVEDQINTFARSLREEGWAHTEANASISRMQTVIRAIDAQSNLNESIQNRAMCVVQRVALLYGNVHALKKLTDQRVYPEPGDRIRIFSGSEHHVVDFYKLYRHRAENLPERYKHWLTYILTFLRKTSRDIKQNLPSDRNMLAQVKWAFGDI